MDPGVMCLLILRMSNHRLDSPITAQSGDKQWENKVPIANNSNVGGVEARGIAVDVYEDDRLSFSDSDEVVWSPRDPNCNVELRCDVASRYADLA